MFTEGPRGVTTHGALWFGWGELRVEECAFYDGLFQGFLVTSMIWVVNNLATWNWSFKMTMWSRCVFLASLLRQTPSCQDVLCHRRISVLSSGQKCKLALGAAFWTRRWCDILLLQVFQLLTTSERGTGRRVILYKPRLNIYIYIHISIIYLEMLRCDV